VLLAAALVGIVLYVGRDALTPFIVGLLVVYLLDPLVERLARRRLPRWLAVILVYAIVLFVIIEALTLTLRPLVDQVSQFVRDLPAIIASFDTQLQRISEIYRGLQLPPQLRTALDEWLASLGEGGLGISPGALMPVVDVTAGLISAVFGYLLIPVWAFYILKDRHDLVHRFDAALPETWRGDVWAVGNLVRRALSQWIRAQVFLGLTVGVATFAGLLLLGAVVDPIFGRFALLLAIIAGLFELLPIIGPILAAIPAVLIAATAGLEAALAALALYLIVQQVENNVLVPKIQGDAVSLHPSIVMFALVIGGAIGGLLGAILALPLTAAARDVFAYIFRRVDSAAVASAPAAAPVMADTVPGVSAADVAAESPHHSARV
jgi:predicted PurR-regulated permease PerM